MRLNKKKLILITSLTAAIIICSVLIFKKGSEREVGRDQYGQEIKVLDHPIQ